MKKYGDDYPFNPVGSGPFKFVEWIRGDHITLEANKGYWRGKPHLDKVVVKPTKESSTRLMQLKTGQLHVEVNLPDQTIPTIEKDKKLKPVTQLAIYTQAHF